ncbi:MAG TPA: hypothetical protein VN603_02870, partial [Candidatus Acidoferrales bacterium]|nr:hypothetical protein [Candidatus Acidoferrales bacterium]
MTQAAIFAHERILGIDALHAATALHTVRPIVDRLLDRVDVAGARRILDPACGDAGFLVPIIDQLVRET